MSKHNETGLKGEQIAEKFLLSKGYQIMHRNWVWGKKEIDLIGIKDDILVFIEVKTRGTHYFGYPEEAVNQRKQGYLRQAAAAFLEAFPKYKKVQFDVISILLEDGETKEIHHIIDAF